MDDKNTKTVAPSFRHSLNVWRRQILPFLIWLGAVGAVLLLSSQEGREITASGIAEVLDANVSSLVDGKIQEISVQLYDSVAEGQIVALMEDIPVKAKLILAESELSRLRAELASLRTRVESNAGNSPSDPLLEQRRTSLAEQEINLDYLSRLILQESDKATLQRLEMLLERQKRLIREKVVDSKTFDEIKRQYELVAERVKTNEEDLKSGKKRLQEQTGNRRDINRRNPDLEFEKLALPLREGITLQESGIRQLMEQRANLALKAPLSGKVTNIFYRPGATVLAGNMVLTITNPQSGSAKAYVSESQCSGIILGTNGEICSRRRSGEKVKVKALRIGPRVEELPTQLRRNPNTPEWGLPVIVGNFSADLFFPGETLDVRLFPDMKKGMK